MSINENIKNYDLEIEEISDTIKDNLLTEIEDYIETNLTEDIHSLICDENLECAEFCENIEFQSEIKQKIYNKLSFEV